MSLASAWSRKFVHDFAQFARAIIDSLLEINCIPIEEKEIFITFTHLKNRKAYKRDQNQIDFLQCSDDHVALPAIICEDYGFLNRMGGGAGSDVLEMLCCFTGRAGASWAKHSFVNNSSSNKNCSCGNSSMSSACVIVLVSGDSPAGLILYGRAHWNHAKDLHDRNGWNNPRDSARFQIFKHFWLFETLCDLEYRPSQKAGHGTNSKSLACI